MAIGLPRSTIKRTGVRKQEQRQGRQFERRVSGVQAQQQEAARRAAQQKQQETISTLSKLNTYASASGTMSARIFDRPPSIAFVRLEGRPAAQVAYYQGRYKEFDPNTLEIITKESKVGRFTSRGMPQDIKTTILSREKIDLSNPLVVQAANKALERATPKRSTEEKAAAIQKRKLLAKPEVKAALGAKRTSAEVKKAIAAGVGFLGQQEQRIKFNRQLKRGKKLSASEYKQVKSQGLTLKEVKKLTKKQLKEKLNQNLKKLTPIEKQRLKLFGKTKEDKKYFDALRYYQLKKGEKPSTIDANKIKVAINLLNQLAFRKNVLNNFSLLTKIKTKNPIYITFDSLSLKNQKDIINNLKNTVLITESPQAKTLFEKLERQRLLNIAKIQKLQGSKATTKTEIEKQLRATLLSGTYGILLGVLDLWETVKNPVQFIKNQVNAIKNYKATAKSLYEEFRQDPLGTLIRYYSFSKSIDISVGAVKRSPVGKFVAEEAFILSQPTKQRPFVRAILESSEIQKAINPTNIKSITKVDFIDVKTITKTEGKALKKTLQTTDSVVFGSKAARILSKGKTKIPKDVDLATKDIKLFSRKFIENLPKKSRKNYFLKGEKLFRKETINGKTRLIELFDVKPLKRLIPQKSLLTGRGRLPISKVGKSITFKGFTKKSLINLIDSLKKNKKEIETFLRKTKDKNLIKKYNKELKKIKDVLKDANKKGLKSKKVQNEIISRELQSITLPRLEKGLKTLDIGLTTGKIITIDNIKLVGFGEQTLRKGLGTLQVLLEKNSKRAKDPAAFIESLKLQIEGLKQSKPKTIIGKTSKNRKIRRLESALKLLTSKEFIKLLDSKVKGLSKKYPLVSKIDLKKLKKARLAKRTKRITLRKARLAKTGIKKPKLKKSKKVKKQPKQQKKSKLPSVIPKSKIPKSKIKSRLPKSKIPSKIPKSKIKSKLQRSKLSKSQIKNISKIPSSLKSKLTPSQLIQLSKLPPSKLKSIIPSILKIPPSKLKLIIPSILKIPPSKLKSIIPSKIKKPPVTKTPPTKPPTQRKEKKGMGYNVLVKKGGAKSRYVQVNNKPFSKTDAMRYLRYVLDNTPLASGKLQRTNKPIGQKFNLKTSASKFRRRKTRSKLPSKVIVEKRKFRIDRPGEKQGISIKGLRRLRSPQAIAKLLKGKRKKSAKKQTKKRKVNKRRVSKRK